MKRITLAQITHLVGSILILIHAFSSFEDKDFKAAAGYFCVAIFALLVAGLDKYIAKRFNQADVAFFLLEGVTLLYSGWDYKMEGNLIMFYTLTFFGGLYFIISFASLLFADNHKKYHHSRRRHSKQRIKFTSAQGGA
jgi:hypothetical protein